MFKSSRGKPRPCPKKVKLSHSVFTDLRDGSETVEIDLAEPDQKAGERFSYGQGGATYHVETSIRHWPGYWYPARPLSEIEAAIAGLGLSGTVVALRISTPGYGPMYRKDLAIIGTLVVAEDERHLVGVRMAV